MRRWSARRVSIDTMNTGAPANGARRRHARRSAVARNAKTTSARRAARRLPVRASVTKDFRCNRPNSSRRTARESPSEIATPSPSRAEAALVHVERKGALGALSGLRILKLDGEGVPARVETGRAKFEQELALAFPLLIGSTHEAELDSSVRPAVDPQDPAVVGNRPVRGREVVGDDAHLARLAASDGRESGGYERLPRDRKR